MVQSLPAKAKCGEHDLCYADRQFRNAEGVTTSSEEAMLEQEQVTIMTTATVCYMLPMGRVLC